MSTVAADLRQRLTVPGSPLDRLFRVLVAAAGIVVLVVLAAIAVSTVTEAWPVFEKAGLGFLTSSDWDPTSGRYGALSFIYGTFVVSALALIVAVPVSVGIALFLTEVAPKRVRRWMVTVLDLLAAVPSVVLGLWAFLTLRPGLRDAYNAVARAVGDIPVLRSIFGPSLSGLSFMTAGLMVGLMITPIITSIAREVFATVPGNDKAGALALGATRWEMIRGVVLPHSTSGLVGAIMLGLGRAMGETIVIALVIGASPAISANLFGPGEAMPAKIARSLNESTGVDAAALIGLGVVLFVLTIAVNMAARGLVATINRRSQGALA